VRALDELFRLHAAEVLAYALRRTDAEAAEDVVSEVFLIAARKLDHVPERDAQLWLYGVARRVLANHRRGARRRAALTKVLGDLQRGPDQPWERPDCPLLEALAALRPADREVLMLSAWEGLAAPAVAVVLGCSPHAVHTRLHRARARLHAEIARRDGVPVSVAQPEVFP
jgi:RNA polymerase sigma-70 factor (ECF subfamily)